MNSSNAGKKDKTVVVGMTGSIDSTVAAYLLTKQDYKCIGLAIVLGDIEARDFNPGESMFGTCLVQDLEKVKNICKQMGFPFYAVNAKDIYKCNILDFIVTSRLRGENFNSCVFCNNLKFDILLEKANILGATRIATGHYAKIKFNRDTGEYSFHASSDLADDQSYYLSRLTKTHFSRLMLPLGDMRKKEVEKVGRTLGYDYHEVKKKTYCFADSGLVSEYVNNNSPDDLKNKGDVVVASSKDVLTEHKGVQNYYVGQNRFSLQDEIYLKNYTVVNIDPQSRKVFVEKEENTRFSYCNLKYFNFINRLDFTKPVNAYAQWDAKGVRAACKILFKTNNIVTLIFNSEEVGPLSAGSIVTLFNRNTATAKVIGSGIAVVSGIYSVLDRTEGMLDEDSRAEVEEDRKNRNIDETKF